MECPPTIRFERVRPKYCVSRPAAPQVPQVPQAVRQSGVLPA